MYQQIKNKKIGANFHQNEKNKNKKGIFYHNIDGLHFFFKKKIPNDIC
jgi:hypothetical protein